jgi:hypothetical protein
MVVVSTCSQAFLIALNQRKYLGLASLEIVVQYAPYVSDYVDVP